MVLRIRLQNGLPHRHTVSQINFQILFMFMFSFGFTGMVHAAKFNIYFHLPLLRHREKFPDYLSLLCLIKLLFLRSFARFTAAVPGTEAMYGTAPVK